MEIGRESGECGRLLGISTFVRDDGGYTVVAMAVALLVSLTLVFSVTGTQWITSRAADIQEVADSAAMAGSNVVAMFSTIAQVLDACVLSMGILGTVICGAGLVIAAIPVLQTFSAGVIDAGSKILDARRSFARSAASGLSKIEKALPALAAVNSASCVYANNNGAVTYRGVALPLPMESDTDYSFLETDVDSGDLKKAAEDLAKASEQKERASKWANEEKARAWKADNVDDPYCLQSRSESLAGLERLHNPRYESADIWHFDYARLRARNYYLKRFRDERQSTPSQDPDELQRSCARRRFYEFAWHAVDEAVCREDGDIPVINLPELPHNTQMVRESTLYTDVVWPCTGEGDERTLHCSMGCPAATTGMSGDASLADIDGGAARRCDTCKMDATAMGRVASASTSINNGFEYYWQIVVDASRKYAVAKSQEDEANHKLGEAEAQSESIFERAMKMLAIERPSIKPAGRYGCVSVVVRGETQVPGQLLGAFLEGGTLPAGVAISAAALAPDNQTDGKNILSSLFDGLRSDKGSFVLDLVGNVTGMWGDLLVGYGAGYEGLSERVGGFLDGIGGIFGEKFAAKLRDKIVTVVKTAGFEPADMRQRKPVLVNTQLVLDKAGFSQGAKIREFLLSLPDDPRGQIEVSLQTLRNELGPVEFTVAEVPIPGTEETIPLTISLDALLGAT